VFGLGNVRALSLRQQHKTDSKAAHRYKERRTKDFAKQKVSEKSWQNISNHP
jgi:hypothetical protein